MTVNDHDQAPHDTLEEVTLAMRTDMVSTPRSAVGVAGESLPPGTALLVVTRGPNAGTRHVLAKAVTSAGRHPESDLFLDDASVSRRHAIFRVAGDNDVEVIDAGSLNGTYVNRQSVDAAILANRDEVQLGKFRLLFLTGGPHAATSQADRETASSPRDPR